MNVICGKCGKEYTINGNESTVKCPFCNPDYKPNKQNIDNSTKELTCPRCNSKHISSNHRGWKLTSGFIGSNKILNTCQICGYQWKPKL